MYPSWLSINANNSLWLSTYNSTYNLWSFNQTTQAEYYCDAKINNNNTNWLSTFNSTYQLWSFNQSILANIYTDLKTSIDNLHKHDLNNLTGSTSISCLNNLRLVNVTFNGTLSAICTDENIARINETKSILISNNNTIWTELLTFDNIEANHNYTLGCVLFGNTSTSGTGIQIKISYPQNVHHAHTYVNNPSSLTSVNYFTCSGMSNECLALGTTGSTESVPIKIHSRIVNGNTANGVKISFKSETTSAVSIDIFSHCEITHED